MKYELRVRITEEDSSRAEVRRIGLFEWEEGELGELLKLLRSEIRGQYLGYLELGSELNFVSWNGRILVLEGSMLSYTEASVWIFELAPWEPTPEVFLTKEDDIRSGLLL